ncbi:MAG: M23 family metallopeptidase [Myxococcales bacterium]|nr:M23 family metallopeptidase [Myxococcales bacterium]MDD9966004.1 M23 family metallopeptidase [Myxococcales bacterium]
MCTHWARLATSTAAGVSILLAVHPITGQPKVLRTDVFERELVTSWDTVEPSPEDTASLDETLLGTSLQGKKRSQRKVPWSPRRRTGVVLAQGRSEDRTGRALSAVRVKALGLRAGPRSRVGVQRWPKEPVTPRVVNASRFRSALRELCPHWTPARKIQQLATGALEAAQAFNTDPFLLAALAYQQSRCGTVKADSWGDGVTRINRSMHKDHIHPNGYYMYKRWNGRDGFEPAQLPMKRYPFTPIRIEQTASNLYFSAAFLRVFSHQCPSIDSPFRSVPHRHAISHLVWGDEVRSALPEDLILTARRRLLGYYRPERRSRRRAVFRHVVFSSPLDGAPRVVIGIMGDPRESGKRRHNGIDFMSAYGEPVRAMADGEVAFAGIDSRKRGFVNLTADQSKRLSRERMGPRGLFVRVDHGGEVSTLYVHLTEYIVETGQRVNRGQVLGYVGRTGMHTSDAHLHLGLFDRGIPVDPLPHLQPLVVTADDIPTIDLHRLEKALSNAQARP